MLWKKSRALLLKQRKYNIFVGGHTKTEMRTDGPVGGPWYHHPFKMIKSGILNLY
jgi:hypothetical protein